MDNYTDSVAGTQWEGLEPIAIKIAQAVVAALPTRTGDNASTFPPAARLAHSMFSELRFALGSSDVVNGTAQQLLPFSVTQVDATTGKGKIKYKRDTIAGLGAKVLTISYVSGAPQRHEVPDTGDEIPIDLDRANAVAVTLWDGVDEKTAAAILVTFVTYR
jgi:hypothetical protein